MNPRSILRAEGLGAFLAATAAYFALGQSAWLYLLLILAPDLSMLGYLAGRRTGSLVYNAAHTYLGPLSVLAVGVWASLPLAVAVALVWTAHIGMDRLVGYGLKYSTEFGDTHLGRLATSTDDAPSPGTILGSDPDPAD